jgi:hypothetical protein
MVAAGYSDRRDDRYDDGRDDWQDNNRGNRSNYKSRPSRVPELPYAEQLNAPCYLHAYVDSKYNQTKSSHLLRDRRQFIEMQKFMQQQQPSQQPPPPPPQHQVQQVQPRNPNESFPPPRGQMSMIHKTGVSTTVKTSRSPQALLMESPASPKPPAL